MKKEWEKRGERKEHERKNCKAEKKKGKRPKKKGVNKISKWVRERYSMNIRTWETVNYGRQLENNWYSQLAIRDSFSDTEVDKKRGNLLN